MVDVRSYPRSRHNPQFGQEALATLLDAEGIDYRWERQLGGRRRTAPDGPNVALRNDAFRGYADHMASTEFGEALDAVLDEGTRRRLTVMCAESVWWRCHRRLLADAAVLTRNAGVGHLMHDGALVPHQVTDGARASSPGGHVVYDVGADRPLPL